MIMIISAKVGHLKRSNQIYNYLFFVIAVDAPSLQKVIPPASDNVAIYIVINTLFLRSPISFILHRYMCVFQFCCPERKKKRINSSFFLWFQTNWVYCTLRNLPYLVLCDISNLSRQRKMHQIHNFQGDFETSNIVFLSVSSLSHFRFPSNIKLKSN